MAHALAEGVQFAECLSPESVEVDTYGHAASITFSQMRFDAESGKLVATGQTATLPARSILVAAGTQPNTVLAREDEDNVVLDGRYFQAVDEEGNPVKPERVAKPSETRVLMSVRPDGKAISFFGDLHPSFSGNVVKAMGSAKRGFPVVSRILTKSRPATTEDLAESLNSELRATVHEVVRLTPNIVEVVVKAPMAARAFRAGPVLPVAELRVACDADAGNNTCDGGPGVNRRFCRSRTWIVVYDCAGDGWIVRSLRAVKTGRARSADGSDRHTDGDAVR